jgi:hypothetical protein
MATSPKWLECAVCFDLPTGSVVQCSNGHIICGDPLPSEDCESHSDVVGCCLASLRVHAKKAIYAARCPTCRVPFSDIPQRNIVAEQAIYNLQTVCIHCDGHFLRGEIRNHERQCPYASLSTACKRGVEAAMKKLINDGANTHEADSETGCSPIFFAIIHGFVDVVDLLLQKQVDANATCTTETLQTPLHVATIASRCRTKQQYCNTSVSAISPGISDDVQKSIVSSLLAAGADVNGISTRTGRTPLIAAASSGNLGLVELFLGVSTIEVNKPELASDFTPLFFAAEGGFKQVIERLLLVGGIRLTTSRGSVVVVAEKGGHKECVDLLRAAQKSKAIDFFDERCESSRRLMREPIADYWSTPMCRFHETQQKQEMMLTRARRFLSAPNTDITDFSDDFAHRGMESDSDEEGGEHRFGGRDWGPDLTSDSEFEMELECESDEELVDDITSSSQELKKN